MEMDFQPAEQLLRTADFEDCRPLWYSSNYVFLAQLCGPGGAPVSAVYKPRGGEAPLWDFPPGTLYQREVAAYRLAALLGWRFIPPTVIRDGPHGPGSLQLYVRHDQTSHFFEQRERAELVPQLQRMAVFDYLANNADRKGGHCLLDAEGRIWGIDHGLCFHEDYKMRTVMWDWAGEEIPPAWLAEVEATGMALNERDAAARAVLDLLTAREAAALESRIRKLLESRRFPRPGPHRSYPWPLV